MVFPSIISKIVVPFVVRHPIYGPFYFPKLRARQTRITPLREKNERTNLKVVEIEGKKKGGEERNYNPVFCHYRENTR